MLRWHVQQGRSAIPKSVKPERIAENFDIFDFELSDDELARSTRSTRASAAVLSQRTSPARTSVETSPRHE